MMKRFTLALLVAVTLLPAGVSAQNSSTTQMQLVASPVFLARLQYLGWQVAQEVLIEPATASAVGPIPAYTAGCHSARVNFARVFISNPSGAALLVAVGVSGANYSGAVVTGAAITGSGATADTAANDTSLKTAMRVQWNDYAGCAAF